MDKIYKYSCEEIENTLSFSHNVYANSDTLKQFQHKLRHKMFDCIALTFRAVSDEKGIFLLVPFILWFWSPVSGLLIVLISDTSELLNGFIKWMIQKPRPFWVIKDLKNIGTKIETDYSFPSGHSQFSSSLLCTILIRYGQSLDWYLWLFLILFPFLTGLSRIYLGVHGIECVLCGWIIGVLFSYLMCTLFVDLFAWFASVQLYESIIFLVCILLMTPYIILCLILKLFPSPNKDLFEEWTIIANSNSLRNNDDEDIVFKKMDPRYLNKYDFELWSLFGGCLGVALQISYPDTLSYIYEECVVEED